jgi:hypothetical protein
MSQPKWLRWVVPILFVSLNAQAQEQGGPRAPSATDMDAFVNSVDKRSVKFQGEIYDQTTRYLNKLAGKERKLRSKMAKVNAAAADSIFSGSDEKYRALQSKLLQTSFKTGRFQNDYIGHLDSIQTSLAFLNGNSILKSSERLKDAMTGLNGLQDKFNQAKDIDTWLSERQSYLQQRLNQWGLGAKLNEWKKQAYYYKAQIAEYKKAFQCVDHAEAKAMQLITQTEAFKEFFSKHSEIGRIFQLPGAVSDPTATGTTNLQSIDAITRQMQQSMGKAVNPVDVTQQGMEGATSQLDDLKSKASQLSAGNGESSLPDFKPNGQRTKRFGQRLQYGFNVQSVKRSSIFPVTTDLALTIGYKLNGRSTAGVGASYKLGWGQDIHHINMSSQGVGLRSFLDWKIKGSLWASGGTEFNYLSAFSKIEQLKKYSSWQQSALLGIMKTYKAGTKMTGTLQLLYDFLWQQQVPTGQPLLFRVGYHF